MRCFQRSVESPPRFVDGVVGPSSPVHEVIQAFVGAEINDVGSVVSKVPPLYDDRTYLVGNHNSSRLRKAGRNRFVKAVSVLCPEQLPLCDDFHFVSLSVGSLKTNGPFVPALAGGNT